VLSRDGEGEPTDGLRLALDGVPVAALIPAMTSLPARLVAGDDADFGVVQAGRAADLVLIEGDPLADPAALDRVAVVVRAGRVVERPLTPSKLPTTP
jgi:enamidase